MCHGGAEKTRQIYRIRSAENLRNRVNRVLTLTIIRTGGRALRIAAHRLRPLFLSVEAAREVNATMTDVQNLIALSLLPSWTWLRAAERLRAGDTAADTLEFLIAAHWRDQSDKSATLRSRALAAMRRAGEHGIDIVAWSDPRYPAALATIVDPPPVLWVRGVIDALNGPAVAIVGSRAGSPYALAVAEKLATDLASRGVIVVSGLARGVDSAAHRGAVTGGVTVAVLGSGVDVLYPPEHEPLAREIQRDGAVISEVVPGTPPQQWFFPLRNRIISGLSRAVVVIEASERSGSLITARCALEQGREVLAVPGNVLSGRNRGAHGLLRDGAKIVESADDILEELHLGTAVPNLDAGAAGSAGDPLLAYLTPGEPSDLDALAERSGLSPTRLLPRLFELELQGAVARVGGGRFVRV
jgi:DNA processing protein